MKFLENLIVRAFPKCVTALALTFSISANAETAIEPGSVGSEESPLRVMLVPTDGGTEDGTLEDFSPIFNAVSADSGLKFKIRVGQSYGSVAEGLANELVDIAFVGPTLYLQAAKRGAAEPLAVAVKNGESVYYGAMFAKPGFEFNDMSDLKGLSMAFGDVNSTSSFTLQAAMMLSEGIDPARDLSKVYLTGSHTNSLNALAQGQVDVAAASLNSYEKAVNSKAIDPSEVVPFATSIPVPYPPFIMHPNLPDNVKALLKASFNRVHESPDIKPEMIRGFGGSLVDRYSSDITHETFATMQTQLDLVTDEVRAEMLRRSSER